MTYSKRLSLTALRTGTSLIILAGALPALAQTPPAETTSPPAAAPGAVEEIVVSGFRHSLESALNNKRESDLPIESVAPEDIGKLPDQNVAEALQRLPGVQIDRSQGQGTAVLIDGLRQNLTTFNGDLFLTGKEFYVSGEGSGGGAGGNAQYSSLEGIPTEEISGIDVYKNPKASMIEGGIGGTVDLKLRDPLSGQDGWQLGGNFRMTENDNDGDWTPVGTLVGQYKLNDRFGVTASFSYDEENTHTYEFQDQNRNQWLITDSALGPYAGSVQPGDLRTTPGGTVVTTPLPYNSKCSPASPCGMGGQYYIIPQLAYFTDIIDQRQTMGASFGVAGKITDAITAHFNWFYSHEDDTNYNYTDKLWFNGQGASPGALLPSLDPTRPYSIDSNGVVQSGTFNANGAETATLFEHNITDANNFQFNTAYNDGGPLRATLDASYSRATSDLEADQADVEHGLYGAFAGGNTSPLAPGCNNGGSTCAAGNHGYEFTYTNGGTSGLPTAVYLAPFSDVLTNPNYTTFKSNWAWANLSAERNWAIRADVEYDPTFIKDVDSTITVGGRYAKESVDQTFGRYLINSTDAAGHTIAVCCETPGQTGPWIYYSDPGYAAIPYSTARSNPGLVQYVNNFAVGNIAVKNPAQMSNPATYLNQVWADAGEPNNSEQFFVDGLSSFNVERTTKSGYVMGDIGGPANRFHVNFGFRLVQTDLNINNGQSALSPTYYGTASWNGVDSNVVAVNTQRSYTDILPSFNFVLDASDTEKVRFSAARVVAPQDLFSLGLGNSYNFTRGGTPTDIIFHFAGGSSGNTQLDPYRASQASLAYEDYFAKGAIASISGFWKQIDNFVEQQNIPTTLPDSSGGGSTTADVSQPVNAGKGKIYGFELGAQYSFDGEAVPFLDGFGVAGNYTRSQSSSDQVTSFSSSAPIPGVAKNSITVQGFYERGPFAIHASYSWLDTRVNDSLVGSNFAFPDQTGRTKVYQIFAAPYGQVDAEVTYEINDNFGLIFQAQNLTGEVQHTYLQWPNQPFTYDDSGRRFFLGGKFKFGSPAAAAPYAAPPPPPPVQPPAPPPAPKVEAARSFQVFFDFDKSNITAAAAKVIQAAADAVRAGHVVQITVTGHTDTVGSAAYNQALSERRAAAVKGQLVADGVAAGEITTLGVGKSGLLVPTADGVREPQNRRAEIVLQ